MPTTSPPNFRKAAEQLATEAAAATRAAQNETTLVNRLEHALEKASAALRLPYSAYSLGRTLRRQAHPSVSLT